MLLTALCTDATASCCLVPPRLPRCITHSAALQLLAAPCELQQLPIQLLVPGFRGCQLSCEAAPLPLCSCHLLLTLHRLLVSSLLGPGQMCLQCLYLACSRQRRLQSTAATKPAQVSSCRACCTPAGITAGTVGPLSPGRLMCSCRPGPHLHGSVKAFVKGFTVTEMQCQGKLAHGCNARANSHMSRGAASRCRSVRPIRQPV